MKRFKIFFRILAALVLTFLTVNVKAVPWATPAFPGDGLNMPETTATSRTTAHFQREDPMAAVTISLLTCSPGTEIWSLYGHTALRVKDEKRGLDVAVNWGLFSYSQPYFIPRFVFGRCDYQMGMEPMDIFLAEYREEGRSVIEQELNLSSAEKQQIINALGMAYQPENRTYRYNFFYDNCTTRARDMVLKHITAAIDWHEPKGVEVSWRDMVHDWNGSHRWARFGKDLLLGVKADSKADFRQREFLPDTLRAHFAKAQIKRDGHLLPLVLKTNILLKAGPEITDSSIWHTLTPTAIAVILFVIVVLLEIVEWRRRKNFIAIDILLFGLSGITGLILLAMVFSLHPTVQVNLQILILNPLWLVLLGWALRHHGEGFHTRFFRNAVSIFFILFLIGYFIQDYAEGITILACILMSRTIRYAPKQQEK